MVNGAVNGEETANGVDAQEQAVGSEHDSAAAPQGQSENLAKDATPVIQPADQSGAQIPVEAIINGHKASKAAEAQAIRETTERPTSNADAGKKSEKLKSKERQMRDALHAYCLKKKPVGEIYSIQELKRANVTKDDNDLLHICNELVKNFLFSPMTLNRGLVYKTRSYDVAKKYGDASFVSHTTHILT